MGPVTRRGRGMGDPRGPGVLGATKARRAKASQGRASKKWDY